MRDFLKKIGIEKYITFHTLRACFATHVLASGVEPTKVMKMGGWADFKTFQIHVRMAGVDVKGVTDDFTFPIVSEPWRDLTYCKQNETLPRYLICDTLWTENI